ncbi:hypothetical protein [Halobacteriovorax sp. RT-2-4]|uniref:hypothetical protein n=1 Tax=unclassified Halobacteriovorax TaxID=2639665 RepID=UPI00399BAED6
MKYTLIIAVIASLTVGFFIGKSQTPNPEIQIKEVEVIKEKKVEVIKEVPVIDKAGDEALAQAFTLFLAALGLEKIKVDKDEVNEIMKDPTGFIARNSIKEKLAPNKNKPVFQNESRWRREKEKAEVKPKVADSIYKNVKFSPIPAIKEPLVYLARTKVIEDEKRFKRMNGSYAGNIKILEGKYKGQTHRIVINIEYFKDSEGKGTDGQSEILLYDEDGKNYSHSRGTGGNRNILEGSDGSFVIRIVDNTFLHFIIDRGMKMANYYDDGKLVGVAKLVEN